jgi:hypothetical protein
VDSCAQYFVADIAAFPGISMAWSSRYGGQPHPFVCVHTPQPMPAPGAALIADFWISSPAPATVFALAAGDADNPFQRVLDR